ncbi:MAG TPA: MCE family protein [Leucothrix mucor]|nr:MCE family protein [Leucothrix mucor]
MTNQEYPTAQISPKSRLSLIWIIPITAALIGGWLVFKYYSERGTFITITFDQASGIEAKKTPIRYKNVEIGKVRKLRLSSDLTKAKVTAEIYPEMAEHLSANTRFWVVKPRLTFQGISGLDTLLSGVYIGMDPGELLNDEDKPDDLQNEYSGLATPPTITTGEKGTALTLNTNNLGSLDVGSPLYYHKINVGEVTGYRLNKENDSVDISIYVHSPYHEKIKTNSRFWNVSGLELELTAGGVTARLESLTSLLIGGIAFDTPDDEFGHELNDSNIKFTLYDSFKLADDDTQHINKLFYVMYFEDTLHGLSKDSVIEYGGVKIGKVENILLESSDESTRIKTLVKASFRIDSFSPLGDKEEAEQTIKNLVSDGLQAQLTVDSLITGAQYISLNMAKNSSKNKKTTEVFALMPTSMRHAAVFPTKNAQMTLLNFDAGEITAELNKAISSVTALINSKDVKKTIKGLASTAESISKITNKLNNKGFSGELVKTLTAAQKTTAEISLLMQDTRQTMRTITNVSNKLQKDASVTMRTISNVSNKLQKDASHTMKTVNNVSNKLQRDTSKTLATLNKGLKSTLSEDSALQYKVQQLLNELSEASNSFSVLADTIQRKPNSVIFGK